MNENVKFPIESPKKTFEKLIIIFKKIVILVDFFFISFIMGLKEMIPVSKQQRRAGIIKYVNDHGYASFNDIKQAFSEYSDMTLRTDLKELDEQGKLERYRGGARTLQATARPDDSYYLRTTRNLEKRQLIAHKAVDFLKSQLELKPTPSIYLDAGVTINEMTKIFPDEWCSIVTNSVSQAYELARLRRPTVSLLGGTLNRYNCSCDSAANIEILERMNFDFAFIPAAGYSPETGFTCGKEVIDETREIVKKHAKKIIIPFDSSKIGVDYPVTHSKIEEVDMIISDDGLSREMIEHFRSKGVEVL